MSTTSERLVVGVPGDFYGHRVSTSGTSHSRTGVTATLARAPRSRALRPFALLSVLVVAALVAVVVSQKFAAPVSVSIAPSAAPVAESGGGASGDAGGDASNRDSGGPGIEPNLLVHVAGSVQTPGLVELPVGSRVADAIDAAGGPLAGAVLDSINLARRVSDGEQLLVGDTPVTHTIAGIAGGTPDAQAGAQPKVNLNTATSQQLEQLPRIGPATAAKILEHRQRNGPFTAVDQLLDVPGIGERTLAGLRDLVQV